MPGQRSAPGGWPTPADAKATGNARAWFVSRSGHTTKLLGCRWFCEKAAAAASKASRFLRYL